jgi:hypothetical protein
MNYLKRERTDRKTGETSFYYQFRAYNPAKQRYDPVPVSSLPKFIRECDSDEVADKYCNLRSSEENAIKARIQKRLEWREKFQDFDVLLEAFGNDHIKKAPNSWGNDVYYLEKYVFSYFLSKKLANNIPEWPLHYKAFKSWLSTTTKLKGKKETLAINTQNKVIKSLNLFLSFYGDENPTEHQIKKCSTYPRNMCRQSTADDILEDHEIEPIFTALKSIRPISADLFYVLTKTGMRISEALGLCVHFITEGAMNGTKISSYHKLISKYDLTYHGYICLESQPKLRSIRDESGKVVRKPLKSRDEIAPKYFRYIPICDK